MCPFLIKKNLWKVISFSIVDRLLKILTANESVKPTAHTTKKELHPSLCNKNATCENLVLSDHLQEDDLVVRLLPSKYAALFFLPEDVAFR